MSDPQLPGLLSFLGAFGPLTIAAAMAVERYIFIVPSYAILAVIGAAAATGAVDPWLAWGAASLGSLSGSLPWIYVGHLVGPERSRRFLAWLGPKLHIQRPVVERWFDRLARRGVLLAGVAQLVPTVRLFSPLVSGALGTRVWSAAGATALGVLVYNGIFIAPALIAADLGAPVGEPGFAYALVGIVVGVELMALLLAFAFRKRLFRGRRRARPEAPDPGVSDPGSPGSESPEPESLKPGA